MKKSIRLLLGVVIASVAVSQVQSMDWGRRGMERASQRARSASTSRRAVAVLTGATAGYVGTGLVMIAGGPAVGFATGAAVAAAAGAAVLNGAQVDAPDCPCARHQSILNPSSDNNFGLTLGPDNYFYHWDDTGCPFSGQQAFFCDKCAENDIVRPMAQGHTCRRH